MKNPSYLVLSLCVLVGVASQAVAEPTVVQLDSKIKMIAEFKEARSFERNQAVLEVISPRIMIEGGDPTGYDLSVYSRQQQLCKSLGYSDFVSSQNKEKADQYSAIINSELTIKTNLKGMFRGNRPNVATARSYSYSFSDQGQAFASFVCTKEIQATGLLTGQIKE